MTLGRLTVVLLSTTFAIGVLAKNEMSGPARPAHAPLPEYPVQLLAESVEGSVVIEIDVDRKGVISRAKVRGSTDPRFEASCEEAIRRWRFHPAKYFGKSTAGSCLITILFEDGSVSMQEEANPMENGIPPKVLKKVAPKYPAELENLGNIGRVTINFIVDTNGDIRDPKVVTSTHPLFEGPAIEALLKWKFAPGTIDGKSVSTNMQLPIVFTLDGIGGVDAFSIDKYRKAKAPGAPKIDVPPKVKATVFAVHPYERAIAGKTGKAEVKALVGPEGNVLGTVIVSASEPEFGLSLAAAMEAWTFDPALLDQKPTLAAINRKYEFETRDRDSAIDAETASLARRIRNDKFTPAKAKELDAPLKPKFAAPPVYPTALNMKGVDGTAKIEVIVDKRGRAVLPRIIEASEPEFGWAAATAVQRWRFDPPTVGGKPVEVKVVIPMRFTAPTPSEATAVES